MTPTPVVPDLAYHEETGAVVDALLRLWDEVTPENHAARNAAFDALAAKVAAWAVEQDRQRPEVADLDHAWGTVWLEGPWRWLTRRMTTPEREVAADAVERHWARIEAEDSDLTHEVSRSALRWWRDGAPDMELEDAARQASAACRTLVRVMQQRGLPTGQQEPALLADADLSRIASGRMWLVWSHVEHLWLGGPESHQLRQRALDAGLYTWAEAAQISAAVTWTSGLPSEVAVICPADLIMQSDHAELLLAHLVDSETRRLVTAHETQGQ